MMMVVVMALESMGCLRMPRNQYLDELLNFTGFLRAAFYFYILLTLI